VCVCVCVCVYVPCMCVYGLCMLYDPRVVIMHVMSERERERGEKGKGQWRDPGGHVSDLTRLPRCQGRLRPPPAEMMRRRDEWKKPSSWKAVSRPGEKFPLRPHLHNLHRGEPSNVFGLASTAVSVPQHRRAIWQTDKQTDSMDRSHRGSCWSVIP
jgi:hypothetical protein